MRDKIFVDPNVCIYLVDEASSLKKEITTSLFSQTPFISPQVIFECINVCRRKLKYDDEESFAFVKRLLSFCFIANENGHVVKNALQIWRKYRFQPYDAKIVATALEAGCNILYSEDMQHGLVVNKSLRIINPFLD